jgi:hypothetical protein
MPNGEDPLVVHIGAREIYDELLGMRDDVRSLAQTRVDVNETLDDHEDRLRSVERWKYGVPVATLSGLISVGAAVYSAIK